MKTKRDYYDVLGISRHASQDDIKQAFRHLALRYHPDRNHEPQAEDKFKEINEAYQVLSNPQSRDSYDRYGQVFTGGMEDFPGFGGFGDIFESFFGGFGAARTAPQQGDSLRTHVSLSFEEAVFGCRKEVPVQRVEVCPVCHGTGGEPGIKPQTCPVCHGAGRVRKVRQSFFGSFTNETICSRCGGKGSIITNPCKRCHGEGRIEVERKLDVNIPAGVDNGYQLRLSGEGDVGLYGGAFGDLYVDVSVEPHPLFERVGVDILYELPMNFAQLALGAEVIVPTLDGDQKLKVPSGTQSGKVFRLKGKGVPRLKGRGRGDQLIRVRAVTPESLDKEQRHIFEELARVLTDPK